MDTVQGAVVVFLSRALAGQSIEIWGDGSVTRDYIYIKDVIDAFIMVMNDDGEPRVFNIGSGEGRSLNELLKTMEELLGRSVERRYLQARKFDVAVNVLDISRAREVLGWRPRVCFRDGLGRTLAWMRNSRAM